VVGWAGPEAAATEIIDGIERFQAAKDKPHF
jgi:hypothetical protein